MRERLKPWMLVADLVACARAALFGTMLAAFSIGCKTETLPPTIGDDWGGGTGPPGECIDQDGDGFGPSCGRGPDCDDSRSTITNECFLCVRDAPGCKCTDEGKEAGCGKVTAQIGKQTTCSSGQMVCRSGTWGACIPDGKAVETISFGRHALGIGRATPCTGNPCDPYCRQFADTPDETLTTRDGLVGTDAGLTLERGDGGARPVALDGPMPETVRSTLREAGLLPKPDAGAIYHELLPTTQTMDRVLVPADNKPVDVYFLDSTSGQLTSAITQLETSLRAPGGVVDRVRSAIPDVWFGVGRYEQYDWVPWNQEDHSMVPYEHVVSMTADTGAVIAGLAWTHGRFHDSGYVSPRSWIEALFALATTGGLSRTSGYWVTPRTFWTSRANTESGPCPDGRVGYPCFRSGALPITVLLADAPANNGPGGQYAYVRSDPFRIEGATPWSREPPVTVAGNGTEASAHVIDPINAYAAYAGSTARDGVANHAWEWPAFDDCTTGSYAAAPNVYFKFRVAERTWFHFDTAGSSFDTVLYLYGSAGAGIGCNERHFFGSTAPEPSSLDGVVEPGDYFLVVDGRRGTAGDYVLHVNAMPDDIATRAASTPNYDEAVDAYRSIGGKVVAVDMSGYACDDGPTSFLQRNTGNALDKLAFDTASISSTGAPYRIAMYPFGAPCHNGDAPLDAQIADAIIGLSRGNMDLSVVAVDADDAIDFDGPPGGPTNLTPLDIDDAAFVASIATVATTDTTANCQATLPDRFVGCRPGTRATFSVLFQMPTPLRHLAHDQIFTLVLRTLRDKATILAETPVVLVVPGSGQVPRADAWFVRDYDTTDVCTNGAVPYWSFFAWNASTPGNSRIDFDIAVAPSIADLATAPVDALQFSDPPGPAGLAGQPISARSGAPDTQTGGTVVDWTLQAKTRLRTSKAMRLRAHLFASPDRTAAPVLQLWNQSISCQPAQ
jgi:hypothetical protein